MQEKAFYINSALIRDIKLESLNYSSAVSLLFSNLASAHPMIRLISLNVVEKNRVISNAFCSRSRGRFCGKYRYLCQGKQCAARGRERKRKRVHRQDKSGRMNARGYLALLFSALEF